MCGIAGILDPAAPGGLGPVAQAMAERLVHRGPDGAGLWADEAAGVALGHRRLAIIDLSQNGHQPMQSSCGRLVLSYNGEVYNAPELRAELEARGRVFRGHSDTEVIVEGAAEWGLEALLPRLIGMFAFALWDRSERRLSLVRDRFGIKPLYWGRAGGSFLFGSELKALMAYPGFDREIDRDAVAAFLRFCYVPAPQSIYRAARKLAPGHLLEVRPGAEPAIRAWWRLADVVRAARAQPFAGGEAQAAQALESLLRDAVARRMVADVPLGAFLSGGVDSSTVTALMQAQSSRPVRTFTIGFDMPGYDEAAHARAVAAHLGTEHQELVLTPAEAMAVIPQLPEIFDEPFADSSQIPTFLVSRMTREHVTVALSGDGGDEIFGGYNRYIEAAGRLRWVLGLPGPVRRAMAWGLEAVPGGVWQRLAPSLPQAQEKAQKLAGALAAREEGFYRRVVSTWQAPGEVVPETGNGGGEGWAEAWDEAGALLPDPVERMQYLDALTYMADDILAKVDRASMAVSLEARVPLMDHRVAAFAWSLPLAMKVRAGQGKRVLRRVLYRHVPRELIERPKQGFAVPIGEWLRAPLRDWAGDLLSHGALARRGLVRPEAVEALWTEHQSGRRDHAARLWAVLVLQAHAA
ncbi:MAG TPA: asparagine synthase (glutamine-hydrolyzing) [Thermohalobaculum sp.]|nr:asparagine synthase (glutamine-hydrolyzing) [Thermohalobaculum sp.]